MVYDHRKSFNDDAKSSEHNAKEATAYKFGVGGVMEMFISDGLNCEETLTQPGMVVELWLKIVDAIKTQHDKVILYYILIICEAMVLVFLTKHAELHNI